MGDVFPDGATTWREELRVGGFSNKGVVGRVIAGLNSVALSMLSFDRNPF